MRNIETKMKVSRLKNISSIEDNDGDNIYVGVSF